MSKPLTPHAAYPPGGVVVSNNDIALPTIVCGPTVPTDTTAGYGVGCIFIHTDGGAGDAVYINEGTATSCDFNAATSAAGTGFVETAGDTMTGDLVLGDAIDVALGADSDALIRWSTGDASNHALVLALGDSNQSLHITDKAAVATDWNVSADTHPTVYVHSNTTPATDYMTFGAHDGTTGHINIAGGTTISLDIAGTAAATLTASALTAGTGVVGVFADSGLRTKQAVNNVHDTVPTAAELATSFGAAATLGRGFIGTVDDADGDTNGYIVWVSDASFYFVKGTKAS